MLFRDRVQAAGLLAERLAPYRGTHPLVAGLPPGGERMAREIAAALEGDVDEAPAARVVILVTDAVTSAEPLEAALRELRAAGAARVALAAAVARPGPLDALRARADDVVCLSTPLYFGSLSRYFVER